MRWISKSYQFWLSILWIQVAVIMWRHKNTSEVDFEAMPVLVVNSFDSRCSDYVAPRNTTEMDFEAMPVLVANSFDSSCSNYVAPQKYK